MLFKPPDTQPGNFFFDPSSKNPNLDPRFAWCHQEMYVFRHNHIGPEINGPFLTLMLDRPDQPFLASILCKKGVAVIAGEGQLARRAIVVALAAFAEK